jgi:hypothetical protein
VVVLLHGIITRPPIFPPQILDQINVLQSLMLTLTNALTADGWVVVYPSYNEDFSNPATFPGCPAYGVQLDIANDAGNGARYKASTLHWWDHVLNFVHSAYGNWPLVPFGVSDGGWHALTVAINKTSTITAYGCHVPVTILSHLSSVFTYPADWTGLTTTGADVGPTALNGITSVPGYVGWSTTDTAVGTTDPSTLANNAVTAGAPVTTLADQTNNHGLYHTDIDGSSGTFTGTPITTWFTGTVDPLCPKVF